MTNKNFASDVISKTDSLVQQLAAISGHTVVLSVVLASGQTKTFQASGAGSALNIQLDVKVLADIRQLDMAERVWQGLAVEQLGQALWPSANEREAASGEGLLHIFSTLDSEQNERAATALSSDWGQYYRSLVVLIGKNEKGKGAKFDTLPTEDVAAYRDRLFAFRFYLRRRLNGSNDPHVKAALQMVPENLRELSKAQLLELARQIKVELLSGVELKQIAQSEEPKVEVPSRTTEADIAGDQPVSLPPSEEPEAKEEEALVERFEVKKWWKKQLASSSARWKFGAMIGVWTVFLVVSFGMTFWNRFFWYVVGFGGLVLFSVLTVALIHKYAPAKTSETIERLFGSIRNGLLALRDWLGRFMNPPVKPGESAPPSSKWLYLLYQILFWLNPINLVAGLWKLFKMLLALIGWTFSEGLGRLWRSIPGTEKLGPLFDTVLDMLREARDVAREDIRRLSESVNELALRLWQYNAVRVSVIALPIAILVACTLAVPYIGVRRQPLWLLIVELLFVGGGFALIFWKRKALFRLVIRELHPTDIPNVHLLRDTYIDRDETSFEPIETIMPVSANPETYAADAAQIEEGAAVLRQLLRNMGFTATEKDGQEHGDEVGENAEEVLTGSTAIMIDAAKRRQRRLRIGVGIDCSISTLQPTGNEATGEKFRRGVRFGLMLEQAITGLRGVQSNFCGFTDDVIFECGIAGEGRITGLVPNGAANNDAAMLHHLTQDYCPSQTVEILMLVSDALPSGCAWGALNLLASELEESGRTVIQVAVDKISDSAIGTVIDLVDKPLVNAATELADIIQQAVEANG